MKTQKIIISLTPVRLHPRSGGAEYTKRILSRIKNKDKKLYIICPKGGYLFDISSNGIYEFSVFRGLGSLLLGFNLSYLVKVFKLVRLIKQNKESTDIQILLNGYLGAISTYVISRIIGAKSTYIAHNVEKERFSTKSLSYVEKRVLPILKVLVPLLEYFATKFDRIVAISYEDKRKFVVMYAVPPEKIVVVPPIAPKGYYPQNKSKLNKKSEYFIVFHGIYNYLPNREGMELIRKYISKRIRYAKFVVFGSGTPEFIVDNFKSLGFVDDLYEFLSSCDIAVVPLRRGAGVKLKVLDYMAAGLPIVTTKKGAEGLDLVNGKHAIIVDDVNEEFVKAIEYLIENPKVRRKLGHNVRKLFEKKYKGTEKRR